MARPPIFLDVEVESLAFGGAGFARGPGGEPLFVHGAAPAERVRVQVTAKRRGVLEGRVVEVLEAGPSRVEPPCTYVDRCGGCCWQQVDYPAQLAAKEALVRHALARVVSEVEPIEPAQSPYGYRERARLHVTANGALGFSGRRSSELVAIERCLLLPPSTEALLERICVALRGHWRAGDELALQLGRGETAQLQLFPKGGVSDALLRALEGLVGEDAPWPIIGAGVQGRWFGADAIDVAPVGEPPLYVGAGSFAQPSAYGAWQLRRLVRSWLDPVGQRVVELFAGAGTLTQALVGAREVVAVEGDGGASRLLTRNAAAVEPPLSLTVMAQEASAALSELASQQEPSTRFDRVLLDPPRAGCVDLLAALARLGAARMVYVSCDPMTLARDLGRLAQLGYRAVRARPVDLMPQTFHVEVVVLLERTT